MHVRKFQSETLDDALKQIKRELGPDAIILKTVTNKGLKGSFKRKKIEITAAISEENYLKKARVDQVLSDKELDAFYEQPSDRIKKSIDGHGQHVGKHDRFETSSYGQMALNRPLSQKSTSEPEGSSALDAFLREEGPTSGQRHNPEPAIEQIPIDPAPVREVVRPATVEEVPRVMTQDHSKEIELLKNKIDLLEDKFGTMESSEEGSNSVDYFCNEMKYRGIDPKLVASIRRKMMFEFSKEQLEDDDLAFETGIKRLMEEVNCQMPKFTSTEEKTPAVIMLVSSMDYGQTSTAIKVSSLLDNSVLVSFDNENEDSEGKTESILNFLNKETVNCSSGADLISAVRKEIDNGNQVVIDFKISQKEENGVLNLVNTLKKSFENVEVIGHFSAVSDMEFNSKKFHEVRAFIDGLAISHVDECSNVGSFYNFLNRTREKPTYFFGVGEIVPTQIENATPERVMSKLFNL